MKILSIEQQQPYVTLCGDGSISFIFSIVKRIIALELSYIKKIY